MPIVSAPLIQCDREICADVLLRVRHGTQLLLRGLKWLVAKNELGHVFLARHVLSALGLNNRVLLAAAADKYKGVVDIPDVLAKDGKGNTSCATIDENIGIHSILSDSSFEHGSTFHSSGDESFTEDSDIYIDIGEDSEEDLRCAVEKMIEDAVENGLSPEGTNRLREMIKKYPVFRIRLGKSPPADVEPMKIRLREGAEPIKVRTRRYSPDQRAFLQKYVEQLKDMDFVTEMPTATWQAAPLLVPKSGSAKYRMTVDLRPINSSTVKEAWPMPNIDAEVQDFKGSKFFAQLDFVSGYWQLPVHPDSYHLCGITTPSGVFASKRVLQGLSNAVSYFQRTVEPCFKEIKDFLKAWLDDFSLYAKTETDLLDYLETFLKICYQRGLYLSAKKCRLFLLQLKWCGRIYNEKGYKMDPSRLSGLKDMHVPETAAELGEFIYCCRWMSIALPEFAKRVSILNDVLEEAYSKSKKRTKKSITNIMLSSLSWGDKHIETFVQLQNDLKNSITLAYPDIEKTICLFTDASDRFWSGVVTQCDKETLKLSFDIQKHEPLAFISSEFRKAQLNWSTFEKEGFAIYQTFKKMDYMLYGHPDTHVFTDHRNLLFIFAPLAINPILGHHIVSKVQRWALVLSTFNYTIEHIRGCDNVFADILTRWTRGYRNTNMEKKMLASILLLESKQLVPSADSIKWPTLEVIRKAQEGIDKPTNIVHDSTENIWKKGNAIWIPDSCHELQLKIIVSGHCGEIGHRGIDATLSVIRESFYWSTMYQDVSQLVKTCYHCLVSRSGGVIPRPLGHALHGKKPNEVIHIDYLYLGKGTENKKYVLVIRDDLSSYTWLWAAESATAEVAAEALCVWIGAFGTFEWLVSDQGSHFKNNLIDGLTSELKSNHHFTTAYSPWANGSVERVCREVLRACRALCSEWKLAPSDWPDITESIQSVLNHAPLKRLGLRDCNISGVYRTPLEVFTGLIPKRPLLRALPMTKHEQVFNTTELEARRIITIDELQNALEHMHKDVNEKVTSSRQRQIRRHNKHTNVTPSSFTQGDFVLVRRAKPGRHKLGFQWKGPKRIVDVKSQWVYEIEDLLTLKREVVHSKRLLLYRADMDGEEISPDLLKAIEHTDANYHTADYINAVRMDGDSIQIQVVWEGLPDESDYTWEPLSQVFEDIPLVLKTFLDTDGNRNIKNRILSQYYSR